ncbi:hypothetical protein AB0E63_33695 [Kribbella sp. NPDC026596]|uniref:hypothetical protein n=1 Tax=Kribbella sp. NPDC026596 TaxID=3155122 RepID=UPI0033EA80D2
MRPHAQQATVDAKPIRYPHQYVVRRHQLLALGNASNSGFRETGRGRERAPAVAAVPQEQEQGLDVLLGQAVT